jgi:MFS family permease
MVPESPVWLLSRGWVQEAEASMRRIRGVRIEDSFPDNLQQELEAMMHSSTRLDKKITWKDRLIFLKRPEAYKPLLITNTLFFFQQFSGIHVVIMYTVIIVQETGVQVDDYLITVVIGISRLLMSFVISYASTRYGRRLLFLVSGVGMALFLGLLAGFLCLTNNKFIGPETAKTWGWIPITALLLSVMMATLGFLTLPFAMMGEIFPAKIRGWACGISSFIGSIFFFLAIKLFYQMKNLMGFHNVCITYTAVIAIGTVFTYFYVPETHNKTLKEIEDFFKGRDEKVTVGGQAAEELKPGSEMVELLSSDGKAADEDSMARKVML